MELHEIKELLKKMYGGENRLITDGNCAYCRYRHSWTSYDGFKACSAKHSCYRGLYPFIKMARPLNDSIAEYPVDPQGEEFYWRATGIFKQIKFEGVPLYVQLYVISSDQGQCNANCWYHAWRLANKRTWRQCGETHLCQNNGSLWFLMIPTNSELSDEFDVDITARDIVPDNFATVTAIKAMIDRLEDED